MELGKADYLRLDERKFRAIRESILEERTAAPMADKFRAFSDPTRIRILTALEKLELCVCDISGLVGLPQPTVSHHLKTLRQLGIIESRRSGKMTFYWIKDKRVFGLLAIARDLARDNV